MINGSGELESGAHELDWDREGLAWHGRNGSILK